MQRALTEHLLCAWCGLASSPGVSALTLPPFLQASCFISSLELLLPCAPLACPRARLLPCCGPKALPLLGPSHCPGSGLCLCHQQSELAWGVCRPSGAQP